MNRYALPLSALFSAAILCTSVGFAQTSSSTSSDQPQAQTEPTEPSQGHDMGQVEGHMAPKMGAHEMEESSEGHDMDQVEGHMAPKMGAHEMEESSEGHDMGQVEGHLPPKGQMPETEESSEGQ